MTVYYEPTKAKWKADVYHNGKRVKRKGGFRTRALAEKFERECLNEIEKSKSVGVEFLELTYDEIFQIWRSSAESRKRESSLTKDDQMHRDYIQPFIGAQVAHRVDPVKFDEIISSALKKGLTKSSVNKIIQHFKAVFTHAMKKKKIPANPASDVAQLKFQESEMDFYHQEELDEFLGYSNKKYGRDSRDRIYFTFYLALFTTGMRLGEVLGLTWDCVDLARDLIYVRQSWNTPKSILEEIVKGKKLRVIPLPSALKHELIAWRNSHRGFLATDLLFSFNGTRALSPTNIRKHYWTKDAEAAEIRRIRLHDARHTYGAHFMMNGGSLYKLQNLLGHESITTTERYAHLAPTYLEGVRDMVNVSYMNEAEVIKMKMPSPLFHPREDEVGGEGYVKC